MTTQRSEAIAKRNTLQWVLQLIQAGHDIGTLAAQVAGEVEWIDEQLAEAKRSRRSTIADIMARRGVA